ncbi:unnamed protein product [Amaranthus hypochondriacus]
MSETALKMIQAVFRRTNRIVSQSSFYQSILRDSNHLSKYSSNIHTPLQHSSNSICNRRVSNMYRISEGVVRMLSFRQLSSVSVGLNAENGVVKFSFGDSPGENGAHTGLLYGDRNCRMLKKRKSRKAMLNELRFYRLKARKKMKSSNPEVRIRYKLEKAKRKEAWLIEKLRKYELPKAPAETYDPEILTEEERFYLKRTGEKKKNYVPVGRRGVFGGVVLNMHLHWKNHETVKVVCKPCKPGQVHEIAEELTRLSKGIVIDIKPDNTVIFYRGKNYVRPEVMSPFDTLSKAKVMLQFTFHCLWIEFTVMSFHDAL